MTPQQRAAALRLSEILSADVDDDVLLASDLLRELAQEDADAPNTPEFDSLIAEMSANTAAQEPQTPLQEAANAVMAFQWSNTREAMDALTRLVDAAYAEPQAEPVAYLHREEGHADVVILAADWDGPCADCIPLYAHGITEAP